MKAFIFAVLAASVSFAQAQVVFYGGDFDGRNAFFSSRGGDIAETRVYDNFTIANHTTITDVFGNFLDRTSPHPSTAHFEFRSGISDGNGGTLIAQGDIGVTATDTGGMGFGLHEWHFEGAITPLELDAGNYWLCLQPIIDGPNGGDYIATTSGTGGVGGPLHDDNSYMDSPGRGINFVRVSTANPSGPWDFSLGFKGSPVPEPSTLALMGMGVAALLRRKRK